MVKRIFLGGLLTALTFVAVPVNSASAGHVADPPCSDPSVQAVGPVQTGSLSGSADRDVWFDDGSRPAGDLPVPSEQYGWVINANQPIRVEVWSESSFGHCSENASVECVETHAPYTCHRSSFGSTPQWIVIENGKDVGVSGQLEYEFIFRGGDPL